MQQGYGVKASASQRRGLIKDEKIKLSVMLGVAESFPVAADQAILQLHKRKVFSRDPARYGARAINIKGSHSMHLRWRRRVGVLRTHSFSQCPARNQSHCLDLAFE